VVVLHAVTTLDLQLELERAVSELSILSRKKMSGNTYEVALFGEFLPKDLPGICSKYYHNFNTLMPLFCSHNQPHNSEQRVC
jgi:hypothetical protein